MNFWARLWRSQLRVCSDDGTGQLGLEIHVRQIHKVKEGLSPSESGTSLLSLCNMDWLL